MPGARRGGGGRGGGRGVMRARRGRWAGARRGGGGALRGGGRGAVCAGGGGRGGRGGGRGGRASRGRAFRFVQKAQHQKYQMHESDDPRKRLHDVDYVVPLAITKAHYKPLRPTSDTHLLPLMPRPSMTCSTYLGIAFVVHSYGRTILQQQTAIKLPHHVHHPRRRTTLSPHPRLLCSARSSPRCQKGPFLRPPAQDGRLPSQVRRCRPQAFTVGQEPHRLVRGVEAHYPAAF